MNPPLENRYFDWLYSHVGSLKARNPNQTFFSLTRQLHQKEFIWLIPNDDNRIEDGKELRGQFLKEAHIRPRTVDPVWLDYGCSVFEMLLALSFRLGFQDEAPPKDWFWKLLDNLELATYSDKVYSPYIQAIVDEKLDRLIWRNYEPNGQGGLFPLPQTNLDQRKVEIWYQLSAYLLAMS